MAVALAWTDKHQRALLLSYTGNVTLDEYYVGVSLLLRAVIEIGLRFAPDVQYRIKFAADLVEAEAWLTTQRGSDTGV